MLGDLVAGEATSAVTQKICLGSTVNLALGRRHSLLDLLERVEALLGVTPQVEFTAPRVGDVRNSENDPTLLESVFPEVSPVELDPALEKTAEWLREHHRG